MYKHQNQKWANMSAGKPSNAPPSPDLAGNSDSGSSNGKKTSAGKGRAQESNKKLKTENTKPDPKPDPKGTTESRARERRRDQNAKGAAQDGDRYEDMNDSDTDQLGDDVKNGNADGQAKHEKMETETSESSEVPGKEKTGSGGRPKDETTAGDQQPEDMDTVEENKKLEESDQKDPLDKDNDVGSDEHDGNHDQQAPEPETPPPQDKIKGIKDKATSRSDKMVTAESTKGAPDTKDTESDKSLARSHEQRGQQQADARNTKRDKQHGTQRQQQSEYQQHLDGHGAWGFHDERTLDKRDAQKAIQTQRSLQASKQMAYQVFANVLTAIEEQEYREAKKYKLAKPEKSEAFIPDQSWKKDEDVLAGVEAQLTVFQAHMGFCPREVAEAAKVEMIDTTLYWAAARAEIGLPPTPTDRYAINLLEILYDGATSNTFQMLKESRKTFGRAELMENVGKIMAGQAKADHLDKQFRDDPRKEAKALPIRQGQNISNGIERLLNIAIDQGMKKRIRRHLEEHLETISAR